MGVTAVAVLMSGVLLWNSRTVHDELTTLTAARASLELDAKAANERANVAERSMEEMKAEMSKVQAANETVNHSVTQLRNQLEQVQIQTNTAREEAEQRLKATADELSKSQAEAARLSDDLAKERAARAQAQKSEQDAEVRFQNDLKQARDDAARERLAREAAERTVRDAATGSSTGAPAQSNP